MASTVAFPCPKCRVPLERAFPSDAVPAPCAHCAAPIELKSDVLAEGALVGCPACGGALLYKQKDFRQAMGCVVVLIASILAPFTYYISLGVAALVDLVLYKLAGDVIICYRIPCNAHVRGLPPGPKVGPFDLSIHDYHRMLAQDANARTPAS